MTVTRDLEIRCDCVNFAPSVERVRIEINLGNLEGKLLKSTLRVRSWQGTLLHQNVRDYDGAPQNAIPWDGSLSEMGRFACPLDSPLSLKIEAEIDDEADVIPGVPAEFGPRRIPDVIENCPVTFEERVKRNYAASVFGKVGWQEWSQEAILLVLYHSVQIRRGPWIADGKNPSKGSMEWVALRLNELGRHGGLIRGWPFSSGDFRRAVRRYKATRPSLCDDKSYAINSDLEEALDEEDQEAFPCFTRKRISFSTDPLERGWEEIPVETTLPSAETDEILRVYQEALLHSADYTKNFNELRDQYEDGKSKLDVEREKLNRPLAPLQAVPFLKSKRKEAVLAPLAVGPVRVVWKVHEPEEDLSRLPANDSGTRSYPKKYIQKVLAAVRGDSGRNCPSELGGIRTEEGNWKEAFWTFPSDAYPPFEVDLDYGRQEVSVAACTDADSPSLGRSGILFNPSFVGGDRYQLEAVLDFSRHKNRDSLVENNGEVRFTTCPIEVWRHARLASVIGWPRRVIDTKVWRRIRQELACCYVDLDLSNVLEQDIKKVLSDEEFASWIDWCVDQTSNKDRLTVILDFKTLSAKGLIGPTKHYGSEDSDPILAGLFITQVLFSSPPAVENIKPKGGLNVLSDLLFRNILRQGLQGIVIVDYHAEALFRQKIEKFEGFPGLVAPSNGILDGLVLVNQQMNARMDYVFVHEMAHCLWLRHHENAEEDLDLVGDHDQSDHNCIMSYPTESKVTLKTYPHQTWDKYNPHFCGKCNLKLRGWDVQNEALPKNS